MAEEPRFYRCQWKLLAEIWCVAPDLTPEEQEAMCVDIRESLGSDFADCPVEYIRDRLYGGFPCGNAQSRTHVYFATAEYSFLAAGRGSYYENDHRGETWQRLWRESGHSAGDGPFTEDAALVADTQEMGCG